MTREMNMHMSLQKQKGVALFVCLMILLIISLLGISAMRMTISQNLIATSSQAADISFQAAETGINKAIQDAEGDLVTHAVLPVSSATPIYRCVDASTTASATVAAVSNSCSSFSADSRGISQVQVKISTPNVANDPAAGQQILAAMTKFGTVPGAVVESYTFEAQGSVPAVGVTTTHVQDTIFPHL